MLLGTLGASLLGNILTGKGTIKAVERTIRAGQDFNATSSFKKILNTSIIKTNLNLIVFIHKIINLE